MPTLDVAVPFTVSLDPMMPDGTPRDPTAVTTFVFPTPGKYDVNDEVAQHWMVPPHLVGYVPPTRAEAAGVEVMVPIEEPPPEGGGGDTTGGAARGGAARTPVAPPAKPAA